MKNATLKKSKMYSRPNYYFNLNAYYAWNIHYEVYLFTIWVYTVKLNIGVSITIRV